MVVPYKAAGECICKTTPYNCCKMTLMKYQYKQWTARPDVDDEFQKTNAIFKVLAYYWYLFTALLFCLLYSDHLVRCKNTFLLSLLHIVPNKKQKNTFFHVLFLQLCPVSHLSYENFPCFQFFRRPNLGTRR